MERTTVLRNLIFKGQGSNFHADVMSAEQAYRYAYFNNCYISSCTIRGRPANGKEIEEIENLFNLDDEKYHQSPFCDGNNLYGSWNRMDYTDLGIAVYGSKYSPSQECFLMGGRKFKFEFEDFKKFHHYEFGKAKVIEIF